MTRDELYEVIRSLEDALNTLNYKFEGGIDRDNPDEIVEIDDQLTHAARQLIQGAERLFRPTL